MKNRLILGFPLLSILQYLPNIGKQLAAEWAELKKEYQIKSE